MEPKKMINPCLMIIVLLAVLSSCEKDEVYTGSLKVTYANHPADLIVLVCPSDNPEIAITDWLTPLNNGTYTLELNMGNYILISSSTTFFPKVGFQIKAGKTTEIIFDAGNTGHVQ